MQIFSELGRKRLIQRRALLVTALILVGLAGLSALSLRSRAAGSPPVIVKTAPPAVTAGPSKPVTQGGSADDLEVQLLVAHTWGFDPPEIVRPEGRFYILMLNHSQLDNLDVRLNRLSGSGGLLKQVGMPRGKTRQYDLYDLPPGEYVLSEAAHPIWSCKLTITPK